MKKRILSLLCVLALCLGLLPVTALAAAPSGQVIYVGNFDVTNGGYWMTDNDGNVTAVTDGSTPADNYICYDKDGNTLTLHNATIKVSIPLETSTSYLAGAAIGVLNEFGNAELTITLEGTNTIANVNSGINMLAASESTTSSSSLTIKGDGSLNASASQRGILVQSNSSDAALKIENAKVTATIVDSYGGNGVLVQSKEDSSASLTVNGGSLTATGKDANDAGIYLRFGSAFSGSGTPTVTVSGNAIVRANGGIGDNSTADITIGADSSSDNGGIVWNGSEGTVYGSVTLQDDLTISEGESLTIGDGANLNTGSHEVIVNGGTLDGANKITGTVKYAPSITTESLPGGTVGEPYTETTLAVSGDTPITWNLASGSSLPAGLTLNENGVISGTPTTAGTFKFTVTATNYAGSNSKEYTIQIAAKSDTTPPMLTAGTVNRTSDKDATVTFTSDEAGTYFYKVVDSGAGEPTDITSGTSYTLTSDTNTITLTDLTAGAKDIYIVAKDASDNQSATLKMEIPAYVEPVYSISANTTVLDFGSACPGYTQPAAKTVTITNDGNQPLILTQPASNSSFEVGTLSKTTLAAGETATFTVQPKAGMAVGTYSEDIIVSGSGNATLSVSVCFTVEHDLKKVEAKDATCTEDGNEEYWICENCGKYFSDANGDTEIEKDSWILNAIDHDWNDVVYTWSDDGHTCTAARTCKNDSDHTGTSTATVTGAQTKEPTCTEKGETTYTAAFEADWAVTQTKVIVDIPATGHSYGEPEWSWSEDGKTCTVTFTCEKDENHKVTPVVTVTSAVKTPATCTEKGVTTDTAAVEFNGQTHTDTKDVADIPATGHSYDNGRCTVCGAIASDFRAVITAGANGSWQKGTKDGLSFTSNAAYKDFQKVQVDGKDLDASSYTVKEGSTIVTLKTEYLETLSVGKHTLAIVSETGTAAAEFTVKAAASANDQKPANPDNTGKGEAAESVQTGDMTDPAGWMLLLCVSFLAVTGILISYRKRAK